MELSRPKLMLQSPMPFALFSANRSCGLLADIPNANVAVFVILAVVRESAARKAAASFIRLLIQNLEAVA